MDIATMMNNLKESAFKALLPIMVVIGIALISIYLMLPDTAATARIVTKEMGTMLLTGAAFAAILKSFQFGGLYQQELLKVFQNKTFKDTIVDAVHFNEIETAEYRVILSKLLAKFLSKRFPSLSQDISNGLLHYSDTTNDYYYDSYVRHITIDSYNRKTKEIVISDNMTLSITAPFAEKEIIYDANSTENAGEFEINSLSIDNQERKQEISRSISHWEYSIKLTGKTAYLVKRTIRRKFRLGDDPYMHSRFKRFAKMCSVDIENKSPDISFFIMHVGARNDQKTKPKTENNHASLSINNLVFPGQGYVIVFAEK